MTSTAKCISPTEAAKLIGIGRTKFYALLKENQIPHIRIGHRILIPVKELENWIHQQIIKNHKIGKE
ncbi:MAG: helix-turn-helix domain-containing protein [Oscillospiraceae bacterium]|nr:helix-turn-helix domain-containing protein [Oscillospiraceae bacterium]